MDPLGRNYRYETIKCGNCSIHPTVGPATDALAKKQETFKAARAKKTKPLHSILGGYKVSKLEDYTGTKGKKKTKFARITEEALEFDSSEPPAYVGEMTEPRARAARHKGQLNFGSDLESFLYAFGDDEHPLEETVRVLDEIVTDFIIETCHVASNAATYSGRQKVKNEDFLFAIRKNEQMLGRSQQLLTMDRELKEARKQFDAAEGKVGLERGGKKKGKKGEEKGEDEEELAA